MEPDRPETTPEDDASATGGRFAFALMPDSPDVRRFIALNSFGADLAQAANALDHAIQWRDSELSSVAEHLVDFAAVAYCRAFLHSKVRDPLGVYLEVPPEFVGIHDTIRAYRNTTVAHSQSELVTTWPVVMLDREHGRRSAVAGTLGQGLPSVLVEDFSRLVEAMLEVLDALIDEVRARLQSEANRIEMGSVPSVWQGLLSAPHTEFNPRTRRREYPVSQTLYASITSTEQPPEH